MNHFQANVVFMCGIAVQVAIFTALLAYGCGITIERPIIFSALFAVLVFVNCLCTQLTISTMSKMLDEKKKEETDTWTS